MFFCVSKIRGEILFTISPLFTENRTFFVNPIEALAISWAGTFNRKAWYRIIHFGYVVHDLDLLVRCLEKVLKQKSPNGGIIINGDLPMEEH